MCLTASIDVKGGYPPPLPPAQRYISHPPANGGELSITL